MRARLRRSQIFVQIASYRDPELLPTVVDALDKADRPEQLTFGICWQGDLSVDQKDVATLRKDRRIRVLQISSSDSKGVCWARAQASRLCRSEPFTLQIDSHLRFVRGWDSLLRDSLEQCPGRSLLTAYLPEYVPSADLRPVGPFRLGIEGFDDDGILGFACGDIITDEKVPVLGACLSAHFLFGPSKFWTECCYDPDVYFRGEEISLAVRAFTSGWKVYYPNEIPAFHQYIRSQSPKHWDDHPDWWERDSVSKRRIRALLGMEGGRRLRVYGLGKSRTLAQYQHFAGVDFRARGLSTWAIRGYVSLDNPPDSAIKSLERDKLTVPRMSQPKSAPPRAGLDS